MAGAGSTLVLTVLAMVAFAANSLLCRLALVDPTIDPASFTAVRLLAGALALALIAALRGGASKLITAGSWRSGAALFAYAAAFSFAYVTLGASTGALILFGAVQITMIGFGMARGEKLGAAQWLGAMLAIGGLAYLLAPGLHAPSPVGAALMAGAGVAWGAYSLLGRSARSQRFEPTLVTAGNFLRATPMALALLAPFASTLHLSLEGIALAIASGAIASGLGYAVWYTALKGLRASEAAIVQLTVPVIAAAGAILLLGEALTLRFVLASAAILGGVALVLIAQTRTKASRR
ncbi:hypothetical protein U91I_02007 [alpha proteobacterium U9-1i]|nr:hypothetical protein U91I_02007 [alpha proteobacterium U9-1i]